MSITYVKGTITLSSQGCENETVMYQRNGHRSGKYVPQLVYALACLLGGRVPQDERNRKKKKKKKKITWVKWCEKERFGAVATFTEEMAFLWRRRPLSFIWWDGVETGSKLKKVWKRRQYGGWNRSKGRWWGQRDWAKWQGFISHTKLSQFHPYNLTQFSRYHVKQAWVSFQETNALPDQMGIIRYMWIMTTYTVYSI